MSTPALEVPSANTLQAAPSDPVGTLGTPGTDPPSHSAHQPDTALSAQKEAAQSAQEDSTLLSMQTLGQVLVLLELLFSELSTVSV